jgi:hypothetical protein
MRIEEANDLLKPGYLPFEAGYKRYEDGLLLVAARSNLINIKREMVEWWFSCLHITGSHSGWHNLEHVYSDWIGQRNNGQYIGGTHISHERFGSDQIHKLKVNFLDPSTILDVNQFENLKLTAIYARIGTLEEEGYNAKVVHLIRDTDYGCEIRSRYWLGYFEGNNLDNDYSTRFSMSPDEIGSGLCKHCHEEMSNFGLFLHDLYKSRTK